MKYTKTESLMGRTMEQLSEDLEAFCTAHDLPILDAAELALWDEITLNQREWLQAFGQAWEAREPEF